MNTIRACALIFSSLLIAGCGNSVSGGAANAPNPVAPPPPVAGVGNVKVPVTETRAGKQDHVVLESRVGGVDVSFEMYEPDQLVAGQSYPLVLHGHGYGGTRQATRTGFIARLTAAGYYVISIDQRGFGAAGGTVRSMSPDFEGQDLVQIVDWAEDLPGLRRRDDGSMLVGSYGGSYGGMYQLLIAGADPQQRLRVLAPDITPHDLSYALNPHNVVKSGWGLVLVGGGEAGTVSNIPSGVIPDGPQQDRVLSEILIGAVLSNSFTESANNFFRYHSVKYFCDGVAPGPQSFVFGTPDPLAVPARPFGKIDVLLTQGLRDTLFNLNDSLNNYNCLKARGGDVRLLTHESGHILAIGPAGGGGLVPLPVPSLEENLDQLYTLITVPSFQDPGASRACGNIVLDDAQFAWFEEKLQGKAGEIDKVITTGSDVCLSLASGDAVQLGAPLKVGGTAFTLDIAIPQFSSALGVGGAVLGNGAREELLATLPLYTAPAGGAIVGGVPTLNLTLEGLSGFEPADCPAPMASTGCDPILLIGIGRRPPDQERWDLMDDQLTAVRGFGVKDLQMTGIAERFNEGDELALLIYGFHAQFPVTWSRDVLVPAMNVSGSINLPILSGSEVKREGV